MPLFSVSLFQLFSMYAPKIVFLFRSLRQILEGNSRKKRRTNLMTRNWCLLAILESFVFQIFPVDFIRINCVYCTFICQIIQKLFVFLFFFFFNITDYHYYTIICPLGSPFIFCCSVGDSSVSNERKPFVIFKPNLIRETR